MSRSTSARRLPVPTRVWSWLGRFGSIILVAAIALGGYYVSHFMLPGSEHAGIAESGETAGEAGAATLVLPEAKRAAAEFRTTVVRQRRYRPYRRVPGSVAYDKTRKTELRATCDSLVLELLVGPGQQVRAGDPIVKLTSPEVGKARIDLATAAKQEAIASRQYDWAAVTDGNLQYLVGLLRSEPAIEDLEQALTGRPLGVHRDQLLTAYSEYLLSRKFLARSEDPETQKVLPGRVLDERRSELEIAKARFRGLVEESEFQSTVDLANAESAWEQARQELTVCGERLTALTGIPTTDLQPLDPDSPDSRLSEFVLVAPRAGTVVELKVSESSRLTPGEILMELADIQTIWVEAQLPQREWTQYQLEQGDPVEIIVPGNGEKVMAGKVRFFEAVVSPTTRAVPLVAELKNDDRQLRPGMFVWVRLPFGGQREGIVIPLAAVQRDGPETFVFVEEKSGGYRRVPVELGEKFEQEVEVVSGLEPEMQVVVSGAFFLKSESLLEAE